MAVKDRPRLGRGLKSLIKQPVGVHSPGPAAGDVEGDLTPPAEPLGERVLRLPLDRLAANPHQPRQAMEQESLKELAASIRSSGVLQPVIVRAMPGEGFQLIAGHRRVEAARIAGLSEIPAIVRDIAADAQQAEWALIENIQRQDLNAMERAHAYRRYVTTFNLTHAQAAERLGEDCATISNFIRLLDLNAGVQDLVTRGILSAGHAKVLAGVADPGRQDSLANRAVTEGLSVRKLEELIAAAPSEPQASVGTTQVSAHSRQLVAKSPHVVELEQDLSRKLGTKLRIFPSKRKNTGKIVIQYYSLDEFDRITEKLK